MLKPCANKLCRGAVEIPQDAIESNSRDIDESTCTLCGRTEHKALIRELEVLNAINRQRVYQCPYCGHRARGNQSLVQHRRYCEKRPDTEIKTEGES